ncbi:DUF1992 domain-containing protein [Desulforamulus ruminis]|uniref:DnaJ family protein n=1 Tax=Desulforamulus ruminis (strain ATCC 23193 / DSM 2154 / NCIMB 8452 / DL) TaxID=696281 RepID=F6DU24_DESRL|nr:DUF1992 domain-containing protein [Desulforamulus ruminis]AEG60099.1 DnaJ family protein [Desulforamulus ruminis DSM 2154]
MDVFRYIAEAKIKQAIHQGEFDHLPGAGKPLELEDLSAVLEELRAGYILLKNAGVLPEEMSLKNEIISLRKLIDCCYDEGEKSSLHVKLNEKLLRFNMLMENRQVSSSVLQCYKNKVLERFGR